MRSILRKDLPMRVINRMKNKDKIFNILLVPEYLEKRWQDSEREVSKLYYSSVLVKFNMLNSVHLQDREFIVLPHGSKMIRRLKCTKIDHLTYFINQFTLWERGNNLYHSIGIVDWSKMPYITREMLNPLSPEMRDYKDEFNEKVRGATTGFDFCYDIDTLRYWDVSPFVKFLHEHGVFPQIMFSGTKGFHIRIPWEIMHEAFPEVSAMEAPDKFKDWAFALREYSNELFPYDNMFYHTRIIKLPYSIAKSGLVALPITYEQFADFDIDMCLPQNVLNTYPLKDRCFPSDGRTSASELRELIVKAGKYVKSKKYANREPRSIIEYIQMKEAKQKAEEADWKVRNGHTENKENEAKKEDESIPKEGAIKNEG
jgi:hypothetical protein